MATIKAPHPGHEKHLCYLNNLAFHQTNVEDYKALIRDAKFFCENCGRAAASEKNLCKPAQL